MLLVVLALLSSSVAANTQPSKHHQPLIYGVPHYPTFTVIHEDGYSGRDIDLINLLSDKLGVTINFAPCEWIRCLEMVKAGKIDILTSVSHLPEREAFIHYIQPAYSTGYVVFWVPKGRATSINRYEDLLALSIGKEKGAMLYKRVDENPNINIYESADFSSLLKMLVSGRIDTVMGANVATSHLVEQSHYADAVEQAKFTHKVPSAYLGLSRKSANANKWLPQFQKQMQDMMLSGELEYFLNWPPEAD